MEEICDYDKRLNRIVERIRKSVEYDKDIVNSLRLFWEGLAVEPSTSKNLLNFYKKNSQL